MKFADIEVGKAYHNRFGQRVVVEEKDPKRVRHVFSGERWDFRGHPTKPGPAIRIGDRWEPPSAVKAPWDDDAEAARQAERIAARDRQKAAERDLCVAGFKAYGRYSESDMIDVTLTVEQAEQLVARLKEG